MIVKELATETSTMKRMGMNIGLILLSVCLAGLSFELLVYMGTRYSGIYWMVQHGSNILLAVLLLFWLRIIWIRFSGWRYGDITFTKIAYGSPDATLEQLIDERNFKLLRDYKAQHIRKYRNQINGEMVLVTYERPKLRVKKRRLSETIDLCGLDCSAVDPLCGSIPFGTVESKAGNYAEASGISIHDIFCRWTDRSADRCRQLFVEPARGLCDMVYRIVFSFSLGKS